MGDTPGQQVEVAQIPVGDSSSAPAAVENTDGQPITDTGNNAEVKVEAQSSDAEGQCMKKMKMEGDNGEQVVEVTKTETEPEGVSASELSSYSYLSRDEFSSERFKIEVQGLPKFYGFGELKKLLNNKLQLNAHKIKPPKKGSGYMFVNFRSEEDREKALKAINGFKWKNNILAAYPAKAAEDPLFKKRTNEEMDKGSSGVAESSETVEEAMKRQTIPWSNLPYSEQLQKKVEATNSLVEDMSKKIEEVNKSVSLVEGRICPIEEIRPSPVTERYRNKCEFTVGYNPVTSEKMVGFRMASYKQGSVGVGPIDHLIHLPKKMIEGALAFQNFVRSSPLNPYEPETHLGCWRELTVRTTWDDQLMLVVLISPKHLKSEDIEGIKTSLKTFVTTLGDLQVNSLFLKMSEGHGEKQRNVPQFLSGEEYITESLLGLQFRISPEAFFQINLKATEVLYSTVGSLLESNPQTTVLDICCGTGTIGICMAQKCGQVLGIEMVPSAVEDAKRNADRNGLSEKCEFFAGKAEDVIDVVLSKAKYENIVAIVDPPRSGLHPRVLFLLRKCEKIKTLIYVSCNARAAMKNFIDLGRATSKNFKGHPFLPKKIIPVDMFPHCHHLEHIVLFERAAPPATV